MGRKHRILVADDDEMVRGVVRTLLIYRGYQVEEAEDGQQAVEKYSLSPNDIDLVMMDLNMPTLSGQEALSELRRVNPEVKAVLISGRADAEVAAGRSPSVRYLQKPFVNDELIQLVREMLSPPPPAV
jgi:CheY-like chemotaxis protein